MSTGGKYSIQTAVANAHYWNSQAAAYWERQRSLKATAKQTEKHSASPLVEKPASGANAFATMASSILQQRRATNRNK